LKILLFAFFSFLLLSRIEPFQWVPSALGRKPEEIFNASLSLRGELIAGRRPANSPLQPCLEMVDLA
jgi:hypothetical protein